MRIHTVGPGEWRENWKTWKMTDKHSMTWNMGWNTEKRAKWEMLSVRIIIWWENWKTWKMRNTNCKSCNMARNTEKRAKREKHTVVLGIWRENWNVENEKQTLFDLEYGRKHWKNWKMRNAHCRTWNMARILKKRGKWEKDTVRTWSMARKLKNMEKQTHTL